MPPEETTSRRLRAPLRRTSAVNVATDTLDDILIAELIPLQLPSLFQEEAGTVTLEVETDCSFAATMTMPQG